MSTWSWGSLYNKTTGFGCLILQLLPTAMSRSLIHTCSYRGVRSLIYVPRPDVLPYIHVCFVYDWCPSIIFLDTSLHLLKEHTNLAKKNWRSTLIYTIMMLAKDCTLQNHHNCPWFWAPSLTKPVNSTTRKSFYCNPQDKRKIGGPKNTWSYRQR